MRAFFTAAAVGLVAAASPASAVNLTGQSVNASFTSNAGNANFVQFSSPQVVGPGAEFVGSFTDVFSQNWQLTLDVNATGFTLDFADGVNGNVQTGGDGAVKIELSNLSGIGPLSFVGYTCSPPGSFACGTFGGGPNLGASGSDAASAFVWFSTLRNGARYEFSFGPAVPEPASWALMIGGFGIAGAALRRKSARLSLA